MFSGAGTAVLRRATSNLRRIATVRLLSSTRDPPPIRISHTDSAGRGVFATRNVAYGELIHTAKPLVAHPSPSLLNQVCYYCLRRLSGGEGAVICEESGSAVRFCGEGCKEESKVFYEVEKRANWSAFDEYCKSKRLKFPSLIKRLACMVISGTTSAKSFDILQPTNLSAGVPRQVEEEFELLRGAFIKTEIVEECTTFLTKQWYLGVLARIHINAFRIELAGGSYEDMFKMAAATVDAEAAVGSAVYMLPSFYNHDCDPNAHIIWTDNVDAKLKALRDVKPDEEFRICYIDTSMDKSARQKILYEGFGFQCNCNRCLHGD